MSRRSFIESEGATCKNWTWSWSFVNHADRVVIFGAWDDLTDNGRTKIFDTSWERNRHGIRNAGYGQSREHIRLVEDEGYTLKTFPMLISNELRDSNGEGPAVIKGFEAKLTDRNIFFEDAAWYAM